MSNSPIALFDLLKKHGDRKDHGKGTRGLLLDLITESINAVARYETVDLVSKVPNKTYTAVQNGKRRSRPINSSLFLKDSSLVELRMRTIFEGKQQGLTSAEINSAIYTAAITFCAFVDVTKDSDQKTPGTFFEYLCASIMTAALGVVPQNSLSVLNLGIETNLPTDFIFDLGAEKPKFHLPVKTSTRERVIQVWAHQRVLDGVYGTGRFLGLPIVLAETKTSASTSEVTEICLPKQWRLYQMHVAQMWRIAYLDIPAAYLPLASMFPPVPVLTLGELLAKGGDVSSLVEKHRTNIDATVPVTGVRKRS